MWRCTICGAKWRGEPRVCPLDGGELEQLPDALLGRTIGGRYVITEKVGAGGMGTVYRARHDVVGRDVAIKFLSPDLAGDPTNRRRFLREAKAANKIDHEHIIDITDYGETPDGLVYLVMEFLEGESLADTIGRGPLPVPRAVDIARQMASALSRAHELDVIHRDIKPENVHLLRRAHGGGDFVKILDFGLAKMKGEIRLTATGAVFGTPEYMAPEQARGTPLTGKADLYALGCVLYEMLTGEPPFDGPTPDLILKHMRETAPPPSERATGIPRELDEVVTQLLQKEPSHRHADAYHLYEELRKVGELLPRPSMFPTLNDSGFADALATELPKRVERDTVSSSTDAWDRRVARFRELTVRAHGGAPPEWLTVSLDALERAIGELARRRAELDRSASAVMKQEDEIRHARLRVGNAIDVLGRDESRALRAIDELSKKRAAALDRLGELEAPLREAWGWLPPAPPPKGDLDPDAVTRLRDAGKLASVWVEAQDAVGVLTRDIARRERDRDDLRFQIAQLKGRLGTLNAEGDIDLDALRDKTRRVDEEVQRLLDDIAARSGELVTHFMSFEALRDVMRDEAAAEAE